MTGFKTHTGIAAPLLRDNIDTDQIIPSREMKRVSKDGLGEGLFAGQRYMTPGSRDLNPDFILNRPSYSGATVILSGQNFGCGSSREHAVWALKNFGICVIIAESFGEIFYNNCITNGVLPVQLNKTQIAQLGKTTEINLVQQTVDTFEFDINAASKRMLLEGLDAISLTLEHQDRIHAFIDTDKKQRPWVY